MEKSRAPMQDQSLIDRLRSHFSLSHREGSERAEPKQEANWLRAYFEAHRTGPGIWKWLHYFQIYDRHLKRFRGKSVSLLEIGIYSGGSLEMWRGYFGDKATIYGVDIEPACRAYENAWTKVTIGDQGSPEFWKEFKRSTPPVDVVIDDGSHNSRDQLVSFKELFPHLKDGGVYICEDVFGPRNSFATFIHDLAHELNVLNDLQTDKDNPDRRELVRPLETQKTIESISLYPYVAVVTKSAEPVDELVGAKHGTEWQPFLA